MRGFRKFAAALVLSSVVASSMVAFGVPVNASTGGGLSNTVICQYLAIAAAFVNRFPDSPLKAYILGEIAEAQAAHGCS